MACGNIYKNKLDEFTGFLAEARTRIVLSKRGRKFFAALEITGKENGAVKRIKRETQTMSQLRLPGKLTIGLGKYREAAGEMMTLIDSIEIFKVNKNGTGS